MPSPLPLQNSPRLRSARADIVRAEGQERVAFAPFLPQIDLLGQYGVVSSTLAPGVPGNEGFLLPNGTGTRSYAQTEVGLEWTLYDFGRTCGRYLAGGRARTHHRTPTRPSQPDRGIRRGHRLPGRPAGPRLPPGARGRRPPGGGDLGRHGRPAQGRRRAQGRRAASGSPTVREPRGPRRGPRRGVRCGRPPEQRHGAQRRLAAGGRGHGLAARRCRVRSPSSWISRPDSGRKSPWPGKRSWPPRRAGKRPEASSCRASSPVQPWAIPTART